MNAIIQPIHLLLYTFLVSTAISLVVKNPLYAIVAIGFMIPAEKFIKKMFGINAETTSGMGSFAGGAIAMAGLQKLAGMGKNFKPKSSSSSSSGDNGLPDGGNSNGIKFAKNPNDDTFGSFNGAPLPSGDNDDDQGDDGGFSVPVPSKLDYNYPTAEELRKSFRSNGHGTGLSAYGTEKSAIKEALDRELEKKEKENGQAYTVGELKQLFDDQGSPKDMAEYEWRKEQIEKARVREANERMAKIASGQSGTSNSASNQNIAPAISNPFNSSPQMNKHWKRKLAGKAITSGGKRAFKVAKGTAKVAARVAGGAAGATIGFSAGVATGDPMKAFTYAAGGAIAGNAISKNSISTAAAMGSGIQGLPGKFEKMNDNIQYSIDEAQYGAKYAREQKIARQNEQATQKFLKDKDSIEKWKDVQAQLGDTGKTTDFMRAVADYKKADPSMSDDMIKNALKLEQEYGNKKIGGTAHKQVVDVAKFTTKNNYGREYVEKEDKRKVLDAHIDSKVSNDLARKQIKEMHAKLNGVGHLRK